MSFEFDYDNTIIDQTLDFGFQVVYTDGNVENKTVESNVNMNYYLTLVNKKILFKLCYQLEAKQYNKFNLFKKKHSK